MTYAIVTNDLSKQYGHKNVVHEVNLAVKEGELFGLLGVNGAGKTTLIHMLCGLVRPTSGDATVLGYSLKRDMDKIKQAIAVSPQETAVALHLTVRENLELMARIHGFSKKETNEKVAHMLRTFSLQPYEKQKSKTLSGGWQRKLSIAMALLTEPRLLFLDEPTLGLDILGRRELWGLITQLKTKTTIILTTHYLEEAEALCDRICIMKDGLVKATGTVDELNDLANTTKFEDAFVSIVTKEGSL